MKYLLVTLLLTCSTSYATDWDAMYKALKIRESYNGKKMWGKNGETGWIHITWACRNDLNKKILVGKLSRPLTVKDTFNEEYCKKMMYHYMTYYADLYYKRTGVVPDYHVYFSIWNHGYTGTKKKGHINRYSKEMRQATLQIIWKKQQAEKI